MFVIQKNTSRMCRMWFLTRVAAGPCLRQRGQEAQARPLKRRAIRSGLTEGLKACAKTQDENKLDDARTNDAVGRYNEAGARRQVPLTDPRSEFFLAPPTSPHCRKRHGGVFLRLSSTIIDRGTTAASEPVSQAPLGRTSLAPKNPAPQHLARWRMQAIPKPSPPWIVLSKGQLTEKHRLLTSVSNIRQDKHAASSRFHSLY